MAKAGTAGEGYAFEEDLADLISEIPPDTIISRTVYSKALRVTLFGFAAGQELTEHTAAHPAVLHFLEGKATVMLGEETMSARPGTWVHMAAHLPHSIFAETPVTMLLYLLRPE